MLCKVCTYSVKSFCRMGSGQRWLLKVKLSCCYWTCLKGRGLSAGLDQWSSVGFYEVMQIHEDQLKPPDQRHSAQHDILHHLALLFFLILSLLSWISSLSKLKIFLSYISHTDPLRQVIWLWFMKLFIFSLVIYLFESESIKINLNPTSSSNLWLSSMYASCLKQLLEKRETSTDPEQMWTRVNWFQLR